MLNVAVLQGRLVADPQIRQTPTGKMVCTFRIACDRNHRDANGQSQADFIDIVAWNGTAEFICRHFTKGMMIAVDGRIQTRQYQDKNGSNRTAFEIVASNVNFCGPKQQTPRPEQAPAAQQVYSAGDADDFAVLDSDMDLPWE